MLSKNQLGFFYMFISVCAFSLMDVIVKWSDEYPVGEVLFFRGFFGIIPLLFLIPKNRYFDFYKTNRPMLHLKRCLAGLIALISIFIAYLISIPIGIYSAYRKDSAVDKGFSLILFILYSMPSFFVGTLLLLQFANPDNLAWFPVSGIQDPTLFDPEWSFWTKIKHRMPFLILPIITYTYGSFAFLSRIMRVGMIDVVSQDYIRTARAKGLGEKKVILKHALRNSLLPIITVFAAIFPMAIGGSIIIEVIFSIPGMGVEVYNSILNYDYPMIITVFTISGFLTMLGYLVADILYAVVDPRISYK